MVKKACLEGDREQYCPQEGSLLARLADSIEGQPSPQQREYFNEVCIHGYLGHDTTAVIDKSVFELKDPGRKRSKPVTLLRALDHGRLIRPGPFVGLRRDYSTLDALLETLPTERSETVRHRLGRSDPIEDLIVGTDQDEPRLELTSVEIERLRIFERLTGSSAYQVFRLAHQKPTAQLTTAKAWDDEGLPCKLCGAYECIVHFAQDEPSPNVLTATNLRRPLAAPPPSQDSTASAQPWTGEARIPATFVYVPCSHGTGACEGLECSCAGSKVWCDKFCGCPPECERRFKGCDCAARGRKECAEGCQCLATSRECDPALCAGHDVGARWLKAGGFCGNNHLSVGRVEPTAVGTSTSPGAGLGLFALEEIKAGAFLGAYGGEHYEMESGYGAVME